jgi:hypothetical protein
MFLVSTGPCVTRKPCMNLTWNQRQVTAAVVAAAVLLLLHACQTGCGSRGVTGTWRHARKSLLQCHKAGLH